MSGLAGYFRDRPIWVKLGLIMMVPTIATVFVGFSALLSNISEASNADRTRNLATLTSDAGGLVHDLQNERAAATILLNADSADQKGALEKYRGLFDGTTKDAHTYSQDRGSLSGLPASLTDQLKTIDVQLGALDGLHQQVADINQVPLSVVIQRYQAMIKSLIGLRDAASQLAGDTGLSYDMRAGSAIANVNEELSQERVIVLQILNQGQLTSSAQDQFLTTLAGQQLALGPFYNVATQAQQDQLNKILSGPNLREAKLEEDTIQDLKPGPLPQDLFTASDWDSAMGARSDLMRQVEQVIDAQTVADASALHSRVQRQVLVEALLLIGLVLIAVLIAWLVARAMNRSLRELRHGALAIAQYGLPQAVSRLRDPSLSSQMSPQQVALQIAEPLPVRSKDEFGQVTEAFNAVHLEAVRTAAEQAALRSSVSTMFVNLARRSQILVDRLIGHLDRLERGEEDPDRLAELFQLDHLATRMRRNDENLLVLAGADSTRVQREPAALIDVLRAAQSEVEHYTRIEFGVIDRDIEVGAHAVNDLVHLVAELFDNATAFSPPDSTVIVEARRVGDRAVLFVEDRGIGISGDQLIELNERLATPPMVDVAVSRMMGLVVVARLAARHGVKVELRPANERGTIADVLLPTAVLVPRALAGRGPSAPPAPRETPPLGPPNPVAPPRSPFATPLALEGGSLDPRNGTGAGLAGPSTGGFGGGPNGFGSGHGSTPGTTPSTPPARFGSGPVNGGAPGGPPPSGDSVGTGRHLPAWSDLTGAGPANGSHLNGVNGGDPYPPAQPPADRFGGPTNNGPTTGPGPRVMGSTDPLPQRRATEPQPVDGELTEEPKPRIPRQIPSSPEAWSTGPAGPRTPPDMVIDAIDADVVEERTIAMPAVPAPSTPPPPAWPPVPAYPGAEPGGVDADDQGAAPPVPEKFAAALDITSEIPRIRIEEEIGRQPERQQPDWNGQSGATRIVSSPTGQPPAVPAGYAPPPLVVPTPPGEPSRVATGHPDETMELPIFRELESASFRGRDSAPAPAPAPAPVSNHLEGSDFGAQRQTTSPAEPVAGAPAGPRPSENGNMSGSPVPAGRVPAAEQSWRSAADDGWTAASAAAEPEVTGLTDAGLPKRVPMAQLVPGGVDKGTTNANRRSPEQVRGLLSAYHRGVQRGRTRDGADKTPESSTAAGNSSQAGREHEA
jgi:methyl-accepting chemotaxis protein